MTNRVEPNTDSHRFGSIASPHHLATRAGEDAFRAGGNAIDAALAAAAALNVVYPNNTALGGDLVALVRTPDGAVHCVNATGPAPAAQSVDRLRALHGAELPLRGIDTITVPGGVRGWDSLRSFGARLDSAAHLTAAIHFALNGIPVSRSLGAAIAEKRDVLMQDEGCSDVFLPGGTALKEGDLLVQPSLGRSLAELQTAGSAALYGGSLGQRLISGLAKAGGVMTLDDLAGFTPEVVEPITGTFRGFNVMTSPPNTQGFSLLRTLQRIQQLGDPGDILGKGAGALASIFEQSNAVRNLMLADPNFTGASAEHLISYDLTAAEYPAGPVRAGGDTVGISAIDSDGYAVSLIQSVFNAFGSAILEPTTGILMQNRGTSFSLDPNSSNAVEPRKRPRHTLMPVLVTRGTDVSWVSSTMGGQGQPQIHAQLLLRCMAGASPAEAINAPRWVVGVQEAGDTNSTIYLESDAPSETVQSLTDDGFALKTVPPHDEWLGHANLIQVDSDGRFHAASDPRSDGSAVEVELTLS
jgi:gamma-glutamyltranspeptidase